MNVEVRIERLVLEGLHFAPAERPRLQAAVERELTRLLSTTPRHGFGFPSASSSRSSRSAPAIPIPRKHDAHSLGNGIASAVYDAIGGAE